MAVTFDYVIHSYIRKKDRARNVMIIINRKQEKAYPRTPFYLTGEDLTKAGKIKNQKYKDVLEDILRNCRKWANDNVFSIQTMTMQEIKKVVENIIAGKDTSKKQQTGFELDFIKFGIGFGNEMIEKGHEGTGRNYMIAINNLNKYLISLGYPTESGGYVKFDVNDLKTKTVKAWIEWIKTMPAQGKRKKGNRAQSLYPTILQKIHNEAKQRYNDEDEEIINIPLSPFKNAEIPAMPNTRKRALTMQQIREIAQLEYKETSKNKMSRYNLSKDLFVLSFYLIGMNSADMYFADDYSDGRINYKRAKTKGRRADEAFFSVKTEPELMSLIEKYKDKSGKRIFCFYKIYATAGTFNAAINKGLKQIGADLHIEDLELGAARHSWATIARNDCKMSKSDVHEFMNHASEGNMKVTDIYLKKDYSLQDEANRQVLDLVFG